MKVTRVEIFDLDGGIPPSWHPVIVRVHTDQGIHGLGEVGLAYGFGHSAGAAMAKELAERFILGADPFQTEMLWEEMFGATFWGRGGGPVVYGAMSALDMALWDIKGKALGVPIYQLLGGKTNDNLRTYASQIQFGWEPERKALNTVEQYADAARRAIGEGYDCIKFDPFIINRHGERIHAVRGVLGNKDLAFYRDRVKAVREAVGPDVDIIIEAHSLLDANNAVQLAAIWEEFSCFYYEEPVQYLSPELHEVVARSVRIPTAAGERLYTRWGFRPYLEAQAVAVIQPDIGLVGGFTEAKKICDMAHTYDASVQIHVCGSPVALAASLQLEAAIPNFLIHEHHTNQLKPSNIAICQQNYQPQNGRFKVPDLPGLGIELNEDVVRRQPPVVVG